MGNDRKVKDCRKKEGGLDERKEREKKGKGSRGKGRKMRERQRKS